MMSFGRLPCGGCGSSYHREAQRAAHRKLAHAFVNRPGACAVCRRNFDDYYAFFDHFATAHERLFSLVIHRAGRYAGMKEPKKPLFFLFFLQQGVKDETDYNNETALFRLIDEAMRPRDEGNENAITTNQENTPAVRGHARTNSEHLSHSPKKPRLSDSATDSIITPVPSPQSQPALTGCSSVACGPDFGGSSSAIGADASAAVLLTCESMRQALNNIDEGIKKIEEAMAPGADAAPAATPADLLHAFALAAAATPSPVASPPPAVVRLAYDAPPCKIDRDHWLGKLEQSECPRGCPPHPIRADSLQNRRNEYIARHYNIYFNRTSSKRKQPEQFLAETYGQKTAGHRACVYCPKDRRLREDYAERIELIEHVRGAHGAKFREQQARYAAEAAGKAEKGVVHDMMMTPLP